MGQEIPQHEAFEWLLKEALERLAERPDDSSLSRALLGVTLQIPDDQKEQWARFCYARDYPLMVPLVEELQRLRKLCFDNNINPDLD